MGYAEPAPDEENVINWAVCSIKQSPRNLLQLLPDTKEQTMGGGCSNGFQFKLFRLIHEEANVGSVP